MTMAQDSDPLREQLAYYQARAAEYDEWWLRQGRYDRGAALNAQWFAEADQVRAALAAFHPAGRVLEFACGTGLWSERLLATAEHLTCLDGSPEMLALNQARLRYPKVDYIQANLFEWRPVARYDAVFFGFWLSHVPPERFAAFWDLVAACLAPGGRVFFVDSRHEPSSTAVDHRLPEREATTLRRRLNDGREFQIYKLFYEPEDLAARLGDLGWRFEARQTEHYFLYGSGSRAGD